MKEEYKYYLVGKVRKARSFNTEYGRRTDLTVGILKSTNPTAKSEVVCVCYNKNSEVAAKRYIGGLIMIQFNKYKEETVNGVFTRKVLALDVSPMTMKEFQAISINERGQYDPFGY